MTVPYKGSGEDEIQAGCFSEHLQRIFSELPSNNEG